jgi:hypothetical protein
MTSTYTYGSGIGKMGVENVRFKRNSWLHESRWLIVFVVVLLVIIVVIATIAFSVKKLLSVTGNVVSSTCQQYLGTKNDFLYNCMVTAVYTVNGKQYQVKNSVNPVPYEIKVNDTVNINYDASNPASSVIKL